MAENKIKHLEFIQNVITRMNSNSFLIKGWAVTLTSALFALAANDANAQYVMITYISIPIFWGLDGYYLSLERKYRELYNHVTTIDENAINFKMDASGYKGKATWLKSTFSGSVWLVYATIIVITTLIMQVFKVSCA